MYTDLCEFELAKKYMKDSTSTSTEGAETQTTAKELMTKQAEWAKTTNDSETAWYEWDNNSNKYHIHVCTYIHVLC